jgi:hypothetical protein
MVIRECPVCAQQFRTFPSDLKAGRGKFCSKRCAHTAHPNRIAYSRSIYRWGKVGERGGQP